MVECELKGIFYNCDEKYFPRHKFNTPRMNPIVNVLMFYRLVSQDIIGQSVYEIITSESLDAKRIESL
jgi:hypothetical protein